MRRDNRGPGMRLDESRRMHQKQNRTHLEPSYPLLFLLVIIDLSGSRSYCVSNRALGRWRDVIGL